MTLSFRCPAQWPDSDSGPNDCLGEAVARGPEVKWSFLCVHLLCNTLHGTECFCPLYFMDTQKCCCAHFPGKETEARRGTDSTPSVFICQRFTCGHMLQLRVVVIWVNRRGSYLLTRILVLTGVPDSSSSSSATFATRPDVLLCCYFKFISVF